MSRAQALTTVVVTLLVLIGTGCTKDKEWCKSHHSLIDPSACPTVEVPEPPGPEIIFVPNSGSSEYLDVTVAGTTQTINPTTSVFPADAEDPCELRGDFIGLSALRFKFDPHVGPANQPATRVTILADNDGDDTNDMKIQFGTDGFGVVRWMFKELTGPQRVCVASVLAEFTPGELPKEFANLRTDTMTEKNLGTGQKTLLQVNMP